MVSTQKRSQGIVSMMGCMWLCYLLSNRQVTEQHGSLALCLKLAFRRHMFLALAYDSRSHIFCPHNEACPRSTHTDRLRRDLPTSENERHYQLKPSIHFSPITPLPTLQSTQHCGSHYFPTYRHFHHGSHPGASAAGLEPDHFRCTRTLLVGPGGVCRACDREDCDQWRRGKSLGLDLEL